MLILDTYNILHASRTAGLGHLDAARLKDWIAASRFASEHTVLVYDGSGGAKGSGTLRHPSEPGVAVPAKSSGLTELYAGVGGGGGGGGADADSVIETILEHEDRLGRGRLAVVVSSDNRVRAAAIAARARTIGSAAFLRMLVDDLRKRHNRDKDMTGGRPPHTTDAGADPARTEYWLREFEGDGEGGPHLRGGRHEATSSKDSRPDVREVDLSGIDMEKLLAERPPPPLKDDDDTDHKTPASKRR